jgi:EmrB/QacA subfamily drug resistance transporter
MSTEHASSSAARRRVGLAALLLGAFMGVLDVFVVTVALPEIRAELGATFGQTQLVMAGYAMAYAVGLITGGRLGDLYGRRRLFVVGGGVFVVASVVCGIAHSPAVLIAARIVQGLGAAAMLPQVLSIIRVSVPGRQRSAAVGWYGAVIGLGAVCGPMIGGLLVAADLAGWGWRLVFLVNAPIGVGALVGVALTVDESRAGRVVGLDLLGAGLSAVGLVALLVPLAHGAESAWPPWMVGSLFVAPLLLGGLVAYERRLERHGGTPLLRVGLFANRAFTGGLGVVFALYAGDALFFVLTYHLQEGLQLSPAASGILLAPVGLGFALASAIAPRLVARGGLLVPAWGIVLNLAGLVGIVLVDANVAAAHRPLWFVPVLLIVGVGHGLAANPLIGMVVSSVARNDAGTASGILLTTTQIANAFGVAVVGSVFFGLLATGSHRSGAAASSFALSWSMVLLAALTVTALPLLRRLRTSRAASMTGSAAPVGRSPSAP